MRVNEIVSRINKDETIIIEDKAFKLQGDSESIRKSEEYDNYCVGNWTVTNVYTKIDASDPIAKPIICIRAEFLI